MKKIETTRLQLEIYEVFGELTNSIWEHIKFPTIFIV